MELTQDNLALIERIIKNDKKYTGNEDLYEDFLNETCKRSFAIVKTVSSQTSLEAYLRKIAATAILNVLKDTGRLRRTREGFVSTPVISLDEPILTDKYSDVKIVFDKVDDDDTPEDLIIQKEILQRVVDSLRNIDEIEPEKNYMKLYKLRYEQGMTQKEIAQELDLSQSEVSKRLFKLMDKVKETLN